MSTDNTIQSIRNWFVQAVPSPDDKNRAVQIGCHYEEVSEMAGALGDEDSFSELANDAVFYKTKAGSFGFDEVDHVELLDALCDQIVTAIGVAHMFNMDIAGALAEVDRSNWSKFKDGVPVFDENGKIDKNPETFFRPDLSAYV